MIVTEIGMLLLEMENVVSSAYAWAVLLSGRKRSLINMWNSVAARMKLCETPADIARNIHCVQ